MNWKVLAVAGGLLALERLSRPRDNADSTDWEAYPDEALKAYIRRQTKKWQRAEALGRYEEADELVGKLAEAEEALSARLEAVELGATPGLPDDREGDEVDPYLSTGGIGYSYDDLRLVMAQTYLRETQGESRYAFTNLVPLEERRRGAKEEAISTYRATLRSFAAYDGNAGEVRARIDAADEHQLRDLAKDFYEELQKHRQRVRGGARSVTTMVPGAEDLPGVEETFSRIRYVADLIASGHRDFGQVQVYTDPDRRGLEWWQAWMIQGRDYHRTYTPADPLLAAEEVVRMGGVPRFRPPDDHPPAPDPALAIRSLHPWGG